MLPFFEQVHAQDLRAFIDLQTHCTMHVPYSFFGDGLTYFDEEPELSSKHLFTNINYANYIENNSGARIIVNGAMCKEVIRTRRGARKKILEQINYINEFVLDHSEKFAVAKSPEELRELVQTTDKIIFIHSIEGGKKLINSQEDAQFWADQGVAFVTLIHLRDDEFGGAAIAPEAITKIINWKALPRQKENRGLTQKGKRAILWLANAGIMTDLTHMSNLSRNDALNLMEEHQIPPIVTHDLFKPIQNQPRGISREDLLRIYKLGGFVSLPISGVSNKPHKPEEAYQAEVDSLHAQECYCEGSVDSYIFTYQKVLSFVQEHTGEILKDSLLNFNALSESQKVRLSLGFQSDFNGWVNHSIPRVGKKGCYEIDPKKEYEAIELIGMPHPGLLESQWNYMQKRGVDLSPLERNAEHFAQIWELLLQRKTEQLK